MQRIENDANTLYTLDLMNELPPYDLADHIRKLRKDVLDLTQEELAAKAEIGVTTLRQIETRIVMSPDPLTLGKLATALGRDVTELVALLPGMSPDGLVRNGTVPNTPHRRQNDRISARAQELAEGYDRLPPMAQLAIDAMFRAFLERFGS